MKRILLLFSALMLSCIALWAHDVEIGGIYYNLNETKKTAKVTCRGDYYDEYNDEYSGSVTIPETITFGSQTYSVTSIGRFAFSYCSGLTEVTIPNSVTSIDQYAFEDCSGLTKVNYLGTVDKWVEIDFDDYYSNPTEYAKDLYINNELLTDVKITTANSIKYYAFYNCQSIKSVEIGNSVTSIGKHAFYNCRGLTSVTIGESVTSIGEWAFKSCSGLTSVTIGNSVTSIGFNAFEDCVRLTSVTIPNSVTSISDNAFSRCVRLTSVSIPNSVTSIGSYAFHDCVSLTSVSIPNSVTSIGSYAFSSCSGLTSITIPNSVTSIGSSAFLRCSGLTSVTIGESVTSIGGWAFRYCDKLTSVTIPNSVTSIGSYAFSSCSGLTSITIPNSVTSIGSDAFSECSGLTSVIWNAKNCKDFSSSSYSPFYDIRSNITSFTFGNEVEHIPAYLCYGMSKLTEMTIPNSVTSIGGWAFRYCDKLTSVSIPNSVTSIGSDAFSSCSGLTSITIPNSVTSIGSDAFSECSGLTSVIWNAKNSKDFEDYDETPFYNIRSNITSFTFGNEVEHIPAYLCYGMSKLTEITIPNSVTSIGSYAFSECSGLTSVIWNAKNCADFEDYYETPFYNIRSSITSFTFGNEVEHIPAYLCYGMSKLSEVTIPNSVTFIGQYAFSSCSGLTSITIPNSVTSIGQYAFSGCSGLTSVIWNAKNYKDFSSYSSSPFYDIRSNITSFTFDNEVEHIPAYLCYRMSKLSEVTIPNSVTSIGQYAFFECSGLTSVTIGESVTSIGSSAFSNCSGLTSITIPNSVTSIGQYAFKSCSGLTSVIWNAKNYKDCSSSTYSPFYDIRSSLISFTFGNEIEHIPAYLCYGMSKLTEITIPNSVTSIGSSAFSSCSGLTSITIPNSVTSIGQYAFKSCSGLTSVIWNAKNYKDCSSSTYSPFYDIRSSLTSFTFGNEIEHIPAYLCYYMNNLKEVTIGNSVTSIGEYAFSGCSGLTKVNYLGTVDKWLEIDFEDFNSNPTYYAKDLYINNELLTDVKITTADSIKNYAFYNCQSIKSVEIGNSVTSIGKSAFYGCSGLTKANYLGTVDKWVEIDFDDSDSNPTYYAKDLYLNNELLADVKITTADSIKNYAFYNCQSIKSVEIGESVTSIGSSAFSGCDKLRKVTAYPTTVPNVYESSFAHYNAALYVPCDVYDDYFFDDVFGTFKVTECIAAEEVDAPDKVEIEVDEDNNAIVIWPSTDGAKKYELEISKDGEVFCTLLFNENGQLTSIDFGNRSASVGFQFTVTGLDSASKYAYSMVAMDKTGNELQSYKGTFTTNGYVPGPGEEDEPTSITETLTDANITVSGGTISAEADFSIYNTIGQNVTAFNGSLQPGVYLVSIGNDIVKVMVH